jgi:hypothetical protein
LTIVANVAGCCGSGIVELDKGIVELDKGLDKRKGLEA